MGLTDALKRGLTRSREALNELFYFGGEVDEDFWEDLEDTLVMGDMGASSAMRVADELRDQAARQGLSNARQLKAALAERLSELFVVPESDPLDEAPVCVLFVGINGAGKTTTVGKIASQALAEGRRVLIGAADTFRAAAIDQLLVWGERSGVEVVTRERGSDPASVCYDVLERAEAQGADYILIDTAGRLHTSSDLMHELAKVVQVTRKRAQMKVVTILVIDAATGQNAMSQAKEFNDALDLDGVVLTKLDGTAKGGIAIAIASELKLPILRVGVGETIDDLQRFDARDFCRALVGAEG